MIVYIVIIATSSACFNILFCANNEIEEFIYFLNIINNIEPQQSLLIIYDNLKKALLMKFSVIDYS